jgi:hypothetical protein
VHHDRKIDEMTQHLARLIDVLTAEGFPPISGSQFEGGFQRVAVGRDDLRQFGPNLSESAVARFEGVRQAPGYRRRVRSLRSR